LKNEFIYIFIYGPELVVPGTEENQEQMSIRNRVVLGKEECKEQRNSRNGMQGTEKYQEHSSTRNR